MQFHVEQEVEYQAEFQDEHLVESKMMSMFQLIQLVEGFGLNQ